jgi:tetratricopeptide (TPR) repeat protein
MLQLIHENNTTYCVKYNKVNIIILKSNCLYITEATNLLINNLNNNDEIIKSKKIYKQSSDYDISRHNIAVIYHLLYLQTLNSDYSQKLIKYYNLSIKLSNSLNNLGFYYKTIDINKAVEYWIISYNQGCELAACNLGNYYESLGQYEKMMEYYLVGAKKYNLHSIHKVATNYHIQQKYELSIQFAKLGISLGVAQLYHILIECYYAMSQFNFAKKYLVDAIKNKETSYIFNTNLTNYQRFINFIDYTSLLDVIHILSVDHLLLFCNLLDNDTKVEFIKLDVVKNKLSVVDIVNSSNSYTLMVSNYCFLTLKNKKKVDKISSFNVLNEQCNICCIGSELCILPCHNNHKLCGNCILSINSCPYCRAQI